jgi:hypothetical protein
VIIYREFENARIDCPLGPQRIDCHDGFADDRDGGVFDSIAIAPTRAKEFALTCRLPAFK